MRSPPKWRGVRNPRSTACCRTRRTASTSHRPPSCPSTRRRSPSSSTTSRSSSPCTATVGGACGDTYCSEVVTENWPATSLRTCAEVCRLATTCSTISTRFRETARPAPAQSRQSTARPRRADRTAALDPLERSGMGMVRSPGRVAHLRRRAPDRRPVGRGYELVSHTGEAMTDDERSRGIDRRGFLGAAASGAALAAASAIGCAPESAPEPERWDHEFDVVVIGSGTGLVRCSPPRRGAKVVVLEKRNIIGGTTGHSGGVAWIPNNNVMNGGPRRPREGVAYLTKLSGARRAGAPRRLSRCRTRDGGLRRGDIPLRWRVSKILGNNADYHPEWPGAMTRGRSIEPVTDRVGLYGPELIDGLQKGFEDGRWRDPARDARAAPDREASRRDGRTRDRRRRGDPRRRADPDPCSTRRASRVGRLRMGFRAEAAFPARADAVHPRRRRQHRRRAPHGDGRRRGSAQHERGLRTSRSTRPRPRLQRPSTWGRR